MRKIAISIMTTAILSGCAGVQTARFPNTPDFCLVKNGYRAPLTPDQQHRCIWANYSTDGEMFSPQNWGGISNAPLSVTGRK